MSFRQGSLKSISLAGVFLVRLASLCRVPLHLQRVLSSLLRLSSRVSFRGSHQVGERLVVGDFVQRTTTIVDIIEVQNDVDDEAEGGEGSQKDEGPEEALSSRGVVLDISNCKRSDHETDILQRSCQTESRAKSTWLDDVRNGAPNSGSVDRVTNTENAKRHETNIVFSTGRVRGQANRNHAGQENDDAR